MSRFTVGVTFTSNEEESYQRTLRLIRRRFRSGEQASELLRDSEDGFKAYILKQHLETCVRRNCTTCRIVRKRILRRRRLQKNLAVLRWVGRLIGKLIAWQARASERVYTPGALGYLEARKSFETSAKKQQDGLCGGQNAFV